MRVGGSPGSAAQQGQCEGAAAPRRRRDRQAAAEQLRQWARDREAHPRSVMRIGASCTNSSKMRFGSCSEMPGPSSITLHVTPSRQVRGGDYLGARRGGIRGVRGERRAEKLTRVDRRPVLQGSPAELSPHLVPERAGHRVVPKRHRFRGSSRSTCPAPRSERHRAPVRRAHGPRPRARQRRSGQEHGHSVRSRARGFFNRDSVPVMHACGHIITSL